MIVLDQNKLSDFLESVSSGFEHSSLEIFIVIVLVLSFFCFLLLVYRIQKKKAHQARLRNLQEKYEELLKKLALSLSDQDLIERLAVYLKDPEKKYLLLINQPVFNGCAAKLVRSESIPASSLAALRVRLKFSARDPEKIPTSSAELPVGLPVLLIRERGKKVSGKIADLKPQSLMISLEGASPSFPTGTTVSLYFQKRSGVFSFTTHVQTSGDRSLDLAHSENIKHYQRRKYYRKKILLPVFVNPAGSEETPVLSAFTDLGGGGASLKNPGFRFKAGDDLELSFFPAGVARLKVVAEVVRVSGKGGTLHVRFEPLKDTSRDRIIRLLFRSKK